jgi:hypothetical protein
LRGSAYRFLLTKLLLAGDISVCCFSKDSWKVLDGCQNQCNYWLRRILIARLRILRTVSTNNERNEWERPSKSKFRDRIVSLEGLVNHSFRVTTKIPIRVISSQVISLSTFSFLEQSIYVSSHRNRSNRNSRC